MTYKLRTRRELAFILIIVALSCAAALLSFGFTYPKPFVDATLGADWQCTNMLIMTSCTKVVRAAPALDHPHNAAAVCRRRA